MQTNDYTPETGRSAGGVVSVLTKSGTNSLHGSVFEFIQNNYFNAKNPFAAPGPSPELRQNDFGGSIGGPIWKDHTFFFFSYEGFRQVRGVQVPSRSVVPTLAEEQNPAAVVAADPYTAGLPLDPIAVNLLKLYPAPNIANTAPGVQNFTYNPNQTQSSNNYDARVDHRFSPNNLFFARFSSNNVQSVIPTALPNVTINGVSVNPGNGQYGFAGPAHDVAYNAQLNFTHIFTPNLLLELRSAYTRIDNNSNSPNSEPSATHAADTASASVRNPSDGRHAISRAAMAWATSTSGFRRIQGPRRRTTTTTSPRFWWAPSQERDATSISTRRIIVPGNLASSLRIPGA